MKTICIGCRINIQCLLVQDIKDKNKIAVYYIMVENIEWNTIILQRFMSWALPNIT